MLISTVLMPLLPSYGTHVHTLYDIWTFLASIFDDKRKHLYLFLILLRRYFIQLLRPLANESFHIPSRLFIFGYRSIQKRFILQTNPCLYASKKHNSQCLRRVWSFRNRFACIIWINSASSWVLLCGLWIPLQYFIAGFRSFFCFQKKSWILLYHFRLV